MLQTTSSSEAELPEFLSCSRRDRSNFFPMISLRVACLTVRTIFGVYNLNFFVELSDLPTFGVPQDNFTPQGNLLLGSQIANSDMDIFQGIDACLSPTQRLCGVFGFVYPPSRNPGFDIFGGEASLTVTITDVPEPSSIASVSTAGLGLWFAWRNRRRTCYKLCE